MDKKIGIVGAGNMGGAIYKGLLNVFPKENIFVSDYDEEKLDALKVPADNRSTDSDEIIDKVDVVILAMKPQHFAEAIYDSECTMYDKVIISIMAGINIQKLYDLTASEMIIRAMPNLALSVGKGLTGWVVSEGVKEEDKTLVKKIFGSLGEEIELDSEEKINELTAISGSGPAYFFNLTEILEQKALELGFGEYEARIMAEQTLIGASILLEKDERSASELKQAVMSPGGTTESAINSLEENDLKGTVFTAIQKAKDRADELSQLV